MSFLSLCFDRTRRHGHVALLLIGLLCNPFFVLHAVEKTTVNSTSNQSHFNVISALVNSLRHLQVAQDYDMAFDTVEKLDGTMNNIIAQGAENVGEDYFRAHTLKAALEIILIEKTLDLDGCFAARTQFQAEFVLTNEVGDALSPTDYPSMVKEAYAILNKLCELY